VNSKKHRGRLIGLIAIGLAVVVVGVIAVIMIVDRNSASGPPEPRPELPYRQELVEQAHPDPACTRATSAKPTGSGEVRVGVLRLRGHCLISEVVLTTESDLEQTLAELRKQPEVVAADRDTQAGPPPTPDDPHAPADGQQERQWWLDQLGGQAVADLWPADAPEIKVGVVDTGIDPEHAEFAGRIADARNTKLGSDRYESHGTITAGVIAAAADGTGVTGIAPKAKLLDAQYWRDGTGWTDDVNQSGIHDEIIWSVDHGARVINVSAGSPDTSLLRAAYAYAELNRVVIIAAVGNCGSADWRPWPHNWSDYDKDACDREDEIAGQADQPTALGVGAINEDGDRAGFSSENRTVMIMAPGEEMLSTCVSRLAGPHTLCTDQGTSFAAPVVSGAAAILVARHPEATPADIRQALIMTTDPVDVKRGERNDEYGYGRLNIVTAAKYLDDHPPKPVPDQPAMVAATVNPEGAENNSELVFSDGTKIGVQKIERHIDPPDLAFSPDGSWFAETDRKTLTVVDAVTGRQQSVDCSCFGVAFTADNDLITLVDDDFVTAAGSELRQYDPYREEWTRKWSFKQPSGYEIVVPRVVGYASGLVLMSVGYPAGGAGLGLVGVRPDGSVIDLFQTEDGIGQVAVSDDGRWVVAAGASGCFYDPRMLRLIDLKRTLANPTAKAYARWLTPPATLSCATTSLHFEGTNLEAGWVAAVDGVRDTCPDGPPDNSGSIPMTGSVTIGEFRASDAYELTKWKDYACNLAGVWHPADGGQLQLRPGPPTGELHRLPQNYSLVQKRPNGEGSVTLVEGAERIVVRPNR
jgi:hypothetical protein